MNRAWFSLGKRGMAALLAASAGLILTPVATFAAADAIGYSDSVSVKLIRRSSNLPVAIAIGAGVVALALAIAYWRGRKTPARSA